MRKIVLLLGIAALVAFTAMGAFAADGKLKVGFIYVGPIGDLGWSHAHNEARLMVAELPWADTVYQEAVPEGKVESAVERMFRQEGCDVVFTTSFGFMDGTVAAAQKYPNKILAHASGFKRLPNLANYMADFYQIYYLNGLMAGALTKSGKVGYVGAYPIPEVKRHIDAYAIGVREVNPKATVNVRWIYDWFNPTKAKEATEALIGEGCDVFAFTEDSPTVVQVAGEKGLPSFGHYSPMYDFSPKTVVSGQLVHWDKFYLPFLAMVYAGVYTSDNIQDVDYWGLLREGAVELGAKPGMAVNPAWKDRLGKTYDLVMKRLEQMKDPQMPFDPFQGPITSRKGKVVIPAGTRASYGELLSIQWAAQGVVGQWPDEP
jgi:basic membrane protein A